MTTAPVGCLDGEQAIRDALADFPDGWESAFIEARETEWGGVVHIGHPWEDEGLAEVITVDTENYSDSPAAMKIAAFIVAANPKSIAGIVAELDRLRSASRQEGEASALNACLAACDRVIEYGGIFEGIDFHTLKKGIERALSASEMREADGWQFVPTTPTDAMTFAGQQARYPVTNSITVIYRAMLAAAPHQSQEAQGDSK